MSPGGGADQLDEWGRRLRINIDTHNDAERLYERWQTILMLTSITSLVCLGVAAGTFDLTTGIGPRAVLFVLTVVGALASALLGSLDLGAKAARHQIAAREYAALRRDVELLALDGSAARPDGHSDLLRRWDAISRMAPNAPGDARSAATARWRPADSDEAPRNGGTA